MAVGAIANGSTAGLKAASGARGSLGRGLRRSQRAERRRGLLLVAPMLLFTLLLFAAPLAQMVWRSVASPEVAASLPNLAAAVRQWDGIGTPPDAVFVAAMGDLVAAAKSRTLVPAATRLNQEQAGMRTLLMRSAARLERMDPAPPAERARETLLGLDPQWGEPATWRLIRSASASVTPYYLLAAVDLRVGADGIERVPPDEALFVDVMLRTFKIAGVVTLACMVLGFPVAYQLANASPRAQGILMILVLLPFWTSLLVRICAWVVLLQKDGVVNLALMQAGLIAEPLQLVFNRTGVYLAMVHVMLPFMILPLYSVMRGISPNHLRAAASLGAAPVRAFLTVYLPQAAPGLVAGALLVFIISIGYYITPALLGGPQDQMISGFIAFFTNQTINWGMASALSVVLLLVTGVLVLTYRRLVRTSALELA